MVRGSNMICFGCKKEFTTGQYIKAMIVETVHNLGGIAKIKFLTICNECKVKNPIDRAVVEEAELIGI